MEIISKTKKGPSVLLQHVMTEPENEEECAICLDQDEAGKITLSECFGCECKQMVHKHCIEEWNKHLIHSETSYCIVCRHQKANSSRLFMVGQAVLATYGPEIEILNRTQANEEIGMRICSVSCSYLAACFCCVSSMLIFLLLIALFLIVR